MSDPEELQGDLVTLRRVDVAEVKRLEKDFRTPGLHLDAGLYKPPSARSLREDMEDRLLYICDVHPEEQDKSVGYAGIVGYSGPPFVFIHMFNGAPTDLDLASDAFLLLARVFFENTDEEQLWTYYDRPVPDEVHDRLIEGGFDAWDTPVPGINCDETACYVLERHTYDAYYDEEAEEDEELLDF